MAASRVVGRHARARPARDVVPFRSLVGHREFRALWLAGAQSQIGDQLARVALSVLVFGRTGSDLATAATYALTYLPALVGGVLLSGLADRFPRKGLLIVCDLARAALFAVMALPHLPLAILCTLLAVAVFVGSPFKAAEPAVVADLFSGATYTAAIGLRTATVQSAQLVGFAVGGVIVGAAGSRVGLLIDAASFAASALLITTGLRARPAVASTASGRRLRIRAGLHTVWVDERLRRLLGLSWLAGWWVVPEGLAAPYAAAHGGGATAVGVLLAAAPAGTIIGALVLSRWSAARARPQVLGGLAVAAGLPLLACAADPGLVVAALLWGASGVLQAYQVLVVARFVSIVPSEIRGQAIGIAGSGLLAAQGAGLIVGGVLATTWAVAPAIAVAGGAGTLLAALLSRGRAEGAPHPRSVTAPLA